MEHLLSPATLTPAVLGACAALAVWGFDLAKTARGGSTAMALFLAVATSEERTGLYVDAGFMF